MVKISVIIVSWNTRRYLDRCLSSLFSTSKGLDLEVWVVDNFSNDGSVSMVKEKYPDVSIIENNENVGFGKANNQVFEKTTGEFLLLLNSDAFVAPGCVQRLLEVIETYSDTGAAGCKLLNEDKSLQRSCYSFPTLATELWQTLWLDRLIPSSKIFGKYLMSYWAMDDLRIVDVVMGAVMLVRREALNGEMLFDDNYFMYSEEVDLCYRLKKRGWAVRYVPDVQAVHIWGGSSNKVKGETLVRLYRSRVQFFRKHYGAVSAGLYKLLILINSLIRWVSGTLVSALTKNVGLKEKSQSYGQLLTNIHAF